MVSAWKITNTFLVVHLCWVFTWSCGSNANFCSFAHTDTINRHNIHSLLTIPQSRTILNKINNVLELRVVTLVLVPFDFSSLMFRWFILFKGWKIHIYPFVFSTFFYIWNKQHECITLTFYYYYFEKRRLIFAYKIINYAINCKIILH